jgi:hypothetical protein
MKLLIEFILFFFISLFGGLALPEVFNAHTTTGAFAGGLLFIIWFCWFVYLMVRYKESIDV